MRTDWFLDVKELVCLQVGTALMEGGNYLAAALRQGDRSRRWSPGPTQLSRPGIGSIGSSP